MFILFDWLLSTSRPGLLAILGKKIALFPSASFLSLLLPTAKDSGIKNSSTIDQKSKAYLVDTSKLFFFTSTMNSQY